MLFLRSAFRPHPPRSVSHRLVPLALGLVLGAALVGCGPEDEPPPRALLGEWKTDAKSHADRGFTIDEHWLRFGTGDYSNANYRVERFETLPERSGRKLVRVHYREPDGSISTLDLSLESGATPRLRFVTRGRRMDAARNGEECGRGRRCERGRGQRDDHAGARRSDDGRARSPREGGPGTRRPDRGRAGTTAGAAGCAARRG
ncbi:MAG: hypothetical protein R3E53_09135 [Myxococcota bacterium]